MDLPLGQLATVCDILERLARKCDAGDEERKGKESLEGNLLLALSSTDPRALPATLSRVLVIGRLPPSSKDEGRQPEARHGERST